MNAVIIMPTYNEASNIEKMVYSILNQPVGVHVLVVDDNSPDGTGDILDRMARDATARGRLHVLHRAGKMGVATAYIQGFRWALAHGFEACIQMDADFSHDPLYLKNMITLADSADIVIGSRYLNGISVINWPLQRILLSWFANQYVEAITKLGIHDCTSGYRLYRRRVLEALDLETIQSSGYSFHVEMSFRARILGFRTAETPIIFEERRTGLSKMSRKIIWEAARMPFLLRLREPLLRRRLTQYAVENAAPEAAYDKAA